LKIQQAKVYARKGSVHLLRKMIGTPEPGEAWLQYLRRTRQFCCLVLLAWSEVEFHIDQIIAKEFGLYYDDKKAKIILELPFGKKLEFLKKQRVIYQEEYFILKAFQESRNKLFHGKGPLFVILSEMEKDALMDSAVEAAHIALDVGLGCHGKRSNE
jgi:hypothetical protein